MSQTASAVRKHLYLVTSHPDGELVGKVEARDKRYERAQRTDGQRTVQGEYE